MSSMMNRWSGVITSTIKKDLVKVETKPKPVESETVSPKKVQTLVSLDPAELEHRRRAKQIEFDLRVARSYNSKNDDARNRNPHTTSKTIHDHTIDEFTFIMVSQRRIFHKHNLTFDFQLFFNLIRSFA
jgi:hypothetical protein